MLPIKEVLVRVLADSSEDIKEVVSILREFAPVMKLMAQMGAAVPIAYVVLSGGP